MIQSEFIAVGIILLIILVVIILFSGDSKRIDKPSDNIITGNDLWGNKHNNSHRDAGGDDFGGDAGGDGGSGD